MDQPKYHIDIFWSDEDGGYIANVPDLLYCSAFGESYEEALREVLVAMDLHLDTLRELDRPIPEPGARRVVGVRADLSESGDTIRIVGRAFVSSDEDIGEVAGRVADAVSHVAGRMGDMEDVVSTEEVVLGDDEVIVPTEGIIVGDEEIVVHVEEDVGEGFGPASKRGRAKRRSDR